jgi:hypothetical protein
LVCFGFGLVAGVNIFAISRRFDRALKARPNIFTLDSVWASLVNDAGVGAVKEIGKLNSFYVGY